MTPNSSYVSDSCVDMSVVDVESETCRICLEELSEPQKTTTCSHVFCKKCFDQWFKSNIFCPCCRSVCNQRKEKTTVVRCDNMLCRGLRSFLSMLSSDNPNRMSMLVGFARVCVLLALLVMYLRSWFFFHYKLTLREKGAEWYYFATMWNFYLHTVYTVVALFTGVIDLVARRDLIVSKSSLEKVMTNLISPLTLFVLISFWVIAAIDPKLLRREGQVIPTWFNMNVHTYIVFLPVVEFSTLPKVASSFGNALMCCTAVGVCYSALIEYTLMTYDFAPYPMLVGLSLAQKVALYSLFVLLVMPFCCAISFSLKCTVHAMQGRKIAKKTD